MRSGLSSKWSLLYSSSFYESNFDLKSDPDFKMLIKFYQFNLGKYPQCLNVTKYHSLKPYKIENCTKQTYNYKLLDLLYFEPILQLAKKRPIKLVCSQLVL